MEHIILECEGSPAAQTLWGMARELWLQREKTWPEVSFGTVMACNLAKFKNNKGEKNVGRKRLFIILVTETAHLIWKIRCERAIQRQNDPERFHSQEEVINKWLICINTRLKMDRLHTSSFRYGKKALKETVFMQTWSGILTNEENLPDNWIRQSSVLVGIRSCRPSGRNRQLAAREI